MGQTKRTHMLSSMTHASHQRATDDNIEEEEEQAE
jgi:hypothetical protein